MACGSLLWRAAKPRSTLGLQAASVTIGSTLLISRF
jgi:hypothetical protein